MSKITKVDFSKFAKQVVDAPKTSSSDSAFLFMAKTLLTQNKVKYGIAFAVYLILTGVGINIYAIYKLILLIF